MDDEDYHSEGEFYYPDELLLDEVPISNSQEEIETFVTNQRAKNTVKKTKSDMNILNRYLESIGNKVEIETLPANELDHLLSKFFMHVKKSDAGSDYEPSTVSSFQRSIQRYLDDKKRELNIFKDKEFNTSRMVLQAKRKSLVQAGKGNKPLATKSLSDAEEEKLFASGQFGDQSPEDSLLQKSTNGEEMLVWLGERGTKTRFGQEKGHQRAFQPKVYATGGERCPLRYYKLFAEHRPAEMNGPECPFFLAIKSNRASNDPVWYKKSPLGKNQIGQFLSIAARNAGINQGEGAKVSNHSVRKTSISRLLDANVPENYVAQLSGHKSTESLNSYKTAGEHHQKAMSLTLSRSMSKDLTPSMNIYEQTSIASEGGCRDLKFLKCIENKTLTGHVISTIKMATPALQLCQNKCFQEGKCVSYNLGPVLGHARSCELNAADHSTRPSFFVNKRGYEYCPIKNPCLSNPCPAGRLCTPDFAWNTYNCDGCKSPLGMEDGRIKDEQINASSYTGSQIHAARNGRLNKQRDSKGIGGWAAGRSMIGEFIQIDLGSTNVITMVATQGRNSTRFLQYVTLYSLSYSNDGNNWKEYFGDCTKVFTGNYDQNTVVTNELEVPIKTRHIRLIVKDFKRHATVRIELYGCAELPT
ncbi:EGF-like repeat and discoidin I-like domain-containing protein 3 [Exaiptasia diaphana]|nr:EGF-like repeat and discoidin I-like domain-containing protein 3 [Exaiptasia diaphana]